MGLNVQWRWNMPAVADPDRVAASNRQGFSEGIGAVAEGLLRRGENRRKDAEIARQQENWERQFDRSGDQWQKQFDRSGDQWQRQFEQNKAVQDFTMNRQRTQDEWLNKWYEQFFGDIYVDDPKERRYRELMAKYGNLSGNAGLVMSGLNPQLF